jgi:RNA recognition motif-containing protein
MNIYVGNLSLETTEDELRREFAEFGEVVSVAVMNDSYIGSGRTRAYAYVEMTSKTEGAAAIANLEGINLQGQSITVIEALPLSHKNQAATHRLKSSYRPNGNRERKCHII